MRLVLKNKLICVDIGVHGNMEYIDKAEKEIIEVAIKCYSGLF